MRKPKVIIVGGGLSALMAALKVAESGVSVLLFSPHSVDMADYSALHAGLNFSTNPKETGDSSEKHFKDTILAGDFLGHQESVLSMCSWGSNLLSFLERMGLYFDRTEENNRDYRPGEGTRYYRGPSGFETGQKILHLLYGQVRRFEASSLVRFYGGWEFVSLVKNNNGEACGIVALDSQSLELKSFKADAILFCTGGYGSIFGRTGQSLYNTGHAVSVLFQQGATFANGEFVQSSLGSLQHFGKSCGLTSYALSEGGRFYIEKGGKRWYFMEEAYPSYRNWVPQDLGIRVLFKNFKDKSKLTQSQPFIYLDLTHRSESVHQGKLKRLGDFVKKFGKINPAKVPIPVCPAVLRGLGGLYVNANHMTNISGVFAAGECASLYHGAYALENNLLLESLYSGQHAATSVLYYASTLQKGCDEAGDFVYDEEVAKQHQLNKKMFDLKGKERPRLLYDELSYWMWENMALIKSNDDLTKTEDKIGELKKRFGQISLGDTNRWANTELVFARHLWGMLELSQVMVQAALLRNESRGCHIKTRFLERDDQNFKKISKASFKPDGSKIEFEDVVTNLYAPEKRSYY